MCTIIGARMWWNTLWTFSPGKSLWRLSTFQEIGPGTILQDPSILFLSSFQGSEWYNSEHACSATRMASRDFQSYGAVIGNMVRYRSLISSLGKEQLQVSCSELSRPVPLLATSRVGVPPTHRHHCALGGRQAGAGRRSQDVKSTLANHVLFFKEEPEPPEAKELLRLCDSSYCVSDFKHMEVILLDRYWP